MTVTKKFTDWKNEPSLDDFLYDLESSRKYHDEYVNKLNKWTVALEGGEVVKREVGKSSFRSKLVRKQSEWSYPLVEEPVLNSPNIFKVESLVYENAQNELTHAQVLNYQWNTLIPKVDLINRCSRNYVNEGTVIVKTGWDFKFKEFRVNEEVPIYAETQEERIKAIKELSNSSELSQELITEILAGTKLVKLGSEKKEVTKIKVLRNAPKYDLVDNSSLLIDPSCKGVKENIKFVIEEIETSYSELKKSEYRKVIKPDGQEVTIGHYRNLEHIRGKGNRVPMTKDSDRVQRESEIDTSDFDFNDDSRQILTMFEYWGFWDIQGDGILQPIVASWVGNTLIRLELNPYPHKQIPYSFASYMPVKYSIHGEPNAELLYDDQESINKLRRGINDITAENAVGQEFVNKKLFYNSVQEDNFKKGKTVKTQGDTDPSKLLYRRPPREIPNASLQLLDIHQREAEHLTGILTYNTGNTKQPTGIGANTQEHDATTKRDNGILRRFTGLLQDLGEKTIYLNQEYLTTGSIFKITGSDSIQRLGDRELEGSFMATVSIMTPYQSDATANKILHMMQTNAASMHPEVAMKHYQLVARLWNQEGLADQIDEITNREPTKEDQRRMQLELEKEELAVKLEKMKLLEIAHKMKIDAIRYSSEVMESKSMNEQADAKYRLAQATKLKAHTALFNQELEYIETGLKRKEEIEDAEYQHARNLETESIRTKRESDNIAKKANVESDNKEPSKQLGKLPTDDEVDNDQVNYAVAAAKDVLGSSLNNETVDGASQLYDGIITNNNVDYVDDDVAPSTENLNSLKEQYNGNV